MILDFRQYIKSIPMHKKLCIYGAGVVAYYLAREIILTEQRPIECFVVTRINNNVDNYFGIPVISCESCKSEEHDVIIATLEQNQSAIVETLERLNVNYYQLRDIEYKKLREKQPDVLAEMYSSLRWIASQVGELEYKIHNLWKEKQYYCGLKNDIERYKDDFQKFKNNPDYEKNVNDLVAGLDCESRNNVYQIISRLCAICTNQPVVYTKNEQKKIHEIWYEYRPNIYQISENKYVYKDYFMPVNRLEEIVFIYEHGLPKLDYPEYIHGKSIIDAGAYVGDSAIVMTKYTKKGNIYSFEAIEENVRRIPVTAKMNQIDNIVPVKMALLDRKGTVKFYQPKAMENRETCSSVIVDGLYTHEDDDVVEVECTTIDDFVKEHQLQVGLLKVDVEGAELQLLKGAVHTLIAQRPTLSIAIYHNMNDFFYIKPWLEALDLGYKFKIFRPIEDFSFMFETVLLAEVER